MTASPGRVSRGRDGRVVVGRAFRERTLETLVLAVPLGFLGLFVIVPLGLLVVRSVQDDAGRFVGLDNYVRYAATPALSTAVVNSLWTATLAAFLAVALAFVLAYGLHRCRVPAAPLARQLLLLPIYAPTMLPALALVFLFGKQGFVTTGLFGHLPGVDIGLYGGVGIVLCGMIVALPGAVLLAGVAFGGIDGRIDDAAMTITASPWRRLWVVVLPALSYGVATAVLASFAIVFTDFGGPKIVGGDLTVLPVQVYQQVLGQQRLSTGAVVTLVLLLPSAAAFAAQHLLAQRQAVRTATLDGRATRPKFRPNRLRDVTFSVLVWASAGAMLVGVLAAGAVSLVHLWPWSLASPGDVDGPVFSLRHFDFSHKLPDGGGRAVLNSVLYAAVSAAIGTPLVFLAAYGSLKLRGVSAPRALVHLLSLLPLALPGLAIGLTYLLLFNRPTLLGLPNPLAAAYGTAVPIIVSNIVHFFGLGYLTAATALRQQDRSFEDAAATMGVSRWRLVGRVTLPLSAPALLDVATYLFVSSMSTVSAVIFLYGPGTITAPVAVVAMDDAGETQSAVAMCVVLLAINLVVAAALQTAKRWRVVR
ncbi:MAG: ABC transporter permease subunit [Tepidisphaerales bacterium]